MLHTYVPCSYSSSHKEGILVYSIKPKDLIFYYCFYKTHILLSFYLYENIFFVGRYLFIFTCSWLPNRTLCVMFNATHSSQVYDDKFIHSHVQKYMLLLYVSLPNIFSWWEILLILYYYIPRHRVHAHVFLYLS